MRQGRTAHAYLFSGSSGVGKTTVARILAAALNCEKARAGEPCGRCPSCLATQQGRHWDLVEIDAASQRGIDEVRSLISRAWLSPIGRRKVYIIDEAHGLTQAAWDALLKTLEEPPEHLTWILCTTIPQHLPSTVVSRCQTFRFQDIAERDALDVLGRVAKAERATVDVGGLRFIAESSGGNLRQALTVLDQVLSANGRTVRTKAVKTLVHALL